MRIEWLNLDATFNVMSEASTHPLKEAGGLWTEDRLHAFLTSPQEFAPGAIMPNPGLDPHSVDALVKVLMDSASTSPAGE